MKTKHLKPKGSIQVRKPDGKHLATEGENLPLTAYWLRRIAEGDLEVSDLPALKTDVATVTEPVTKPTKAEK
ncbi:DUF2635 domain-containing protein [Serratia fonticola]|uniref:DUF2635 domain-containing protein n=1 Tax=Serratia fonticola TaxID=47917 RepID=UPI0013783AC4|nr:DUF2635 domain-containing protein [Serratia fonticola]NBJ36620.1 DUF2635 domain-containing protein [Serratia fonticola]